MGQLIVRKIVSPIGKREVFHIQPFLRQIKKLDPHNLSYTVRNNLENYRSWAKATKRSEYRKEPEANRTPAWRLSRLLSNRRCAATGRIEGIILPSRLSYYAHTRIGHRTAPC